MFHRVYIIRVLLIMIMVMDMAMDIIIPRVQSLSDRRLRLEQFIVTALGVTVTRDVVIDTITIREITDMDRTSGLAATVNLI